MRPIDAVLRLQIQHQPAPVTGLVPIIARFPHRSYRNIQDHMLITGLNTLLGLGMRIQLRHIHMNGTIRGQGVIEERGVGVRVIKWNKDQLY